MENINLHTHSKYSLDGTLDINEVINTCFNNGIIYLSITDHNTCDSYLDLDINKINKSGTVIYGMEADAIVNNITYDILCYGFDLAPVNTWAKKQYGTIESRQTKIYLKLEELCNSLNIKLDKTISFNPEKEFAHSAILRMIENVEENKEFLNKYNIKTINDFYRKSTMDTNFPLYIDMSIVWPTIETLAQIIHENGGKIFLAHPYKYIRDNNIDWLLSNCLPHIDGIEISNEPKNFEEVSYLYSLAKNNNKLISAGSDYHGSKLHNDYHVKYITEEMEIDIINWIKSINGKIQINY